MYAKKVLDLLFQHVKNGSENKSVAFIFLFNEDILISALMPVSTMTNYFFQL